jgi:hypothetical protein
MHASHASAWAIRATTASGVSTSWRQVTRITV